MAEEFWLHPPPEEWASLLDTENKRGDCPKIEGIYKFRGASITYWRGGEESRESNASASVISDWHIRGQSARREESRERYPRVSPNTFEIRQTERGFYSVQDIYWRSPNEVSVTDFDMSRGDYTCRNGWIIFSKEGEGGIEGTSTSHKATIAITKLKDHSIMCYWYSKTIRSALLIFRAEIMSEKYYRFEPAPQDVMTGTQSR